MTDPMTDHSPGRCPLAHSVFDPAVQNDPYRYYAEMHARDPVHYDPAADLWLVTSHALIMQAARDPAVFSSEIDMRTDVAGPDTSGSEALLAREGWIVRDVLTQADPPRHTMFRKLVDRLFTGPVAKRMEAYIEAHVDELIDGFASAGEVEFMRQFAIPLPLDVIADQLGVPRADNDRFKAWTDAIIATLGIMITPGRKLECTRHIIAFQHYFVEKMAEKRAAPAQDIISAIARARLEQEDRELTVEERLALIQQLLVAGNETTRNHLAKCMVLLAGDPALQARLSAEPSRIPAFVEESLRLESPVQGIFRQTTCEVTLGEARLPAGAKLLLMYGAGNRDPEKFPEPARLDVERANANRHLAFGYGIHGCIGAMLARKELEVAIRQLLTRLGEISLAPGQKPPTHKPNIILRGIEGELRLVFKPAG